MSETTVEAATPALAHGETETEQKLLDYLAQYLALVEKAKNYAVSLSPSPQEQL